MQWLHMNTFTRELESNKIGTHFVETERIIYLYKNSIGPNVSRSRHHRKRLCKMYRNISRSRFFCRMTKRSIMCVIFHVCKMFVFEHFLFKDTHLDVENLAKMSILCQTSMY